MNKPPLLGVIADTHILSTVGLMPPAFKTTNELIIHQNPLQKWLWDCWQDGISQMLDIAGADPIDIVHNGDAIEGRHHRTVEVATLDPTDDIRAAKEVFDPVRQRVRKWIQVRGTECHTGNKELTLGEVLNAEKNPDSGLPVFDRLPLNINGVRCLFRHHISVALRPYLEASALSIHLAEEQLEASRNYEPVPRIVVGAHRHRHGLYSNGHEMCIACPPFQALTRHGHKVVSASRCKPGMFLFDWRGKRPGELPEVHSFIYRAPEASALALDDIPLTEAPPPGRPKPAPIATT